MKKSTWFARPITFILAALTSIFILILINAYNQREELFQIAMQRAIEKARDEYKLRIEIKEAHLSGLSKATFKDLRAIPLGRDTIAQIEHLEVGVKLIPLLMGEVNLSSIVLENGKINLVRKKGITNYEFLLKKKNQSNDAELNLSKLASRALDQVFRIIPEEMDIKNFNIRFKDDSTQLSLSTTRASIKEQQVKSDIFLGGQNRPWHVEGFVYPGKKQLDLALFADGKKIELPYLKQKYGLKLQFDTIRTQMKRVARSGDDLEISGSWSVRNLVLNHRRIASNDIVVESASIDADTRFGKNFVALDSTSVLHMKQINVRPFVQYTLRPDKIYQLKIKTGKIDAQQLWNAFPKGMFESLEGMQVSGQLAYHLNLYLDSKKPDQVQFESGLNRENFKILRWGKTNLQKINEPFVYTPYEYGKPMRDIYVGPENTYYTPIGLVAPDLKNALLTAEDPSFYSHNGFVPEAIRKSIATNFEKKAFKRGGSTISMQLVKNIYLSRQKTLARKIEEMLLVWLIENGRLCTKQRMFEVYLNIIEWGPDIYGIGEASRFYFAKQPAALSLGESIFLASIVPRPKSGLYFFEPNGGLRPNLHGTFKFVGSSMNRRKLIVQDSTSNFGFYAVRLRPDLRKAVSQGDNLILDEDIQEGVEDLLEPLFGKSHRDSIP